jgi:antitoxin PrlF
LFRSHPEFNGEVTAHVIAPGRMLVTAEAEVIEEEDPVLAAFLAFLAKEMEANPGRIRPLDAKLAKRAARLTKGMELNLNEDLGEESLL